MEQFGTTDAKKKQASITAFAVKMPLYGVTRPLPTKRPCAKRGPGRPRKKPRQDDWEQQWYDAVESEHCSVVGVFDSYGAA